MRGFSEYKQANQPVLGEKAYFTFIKNQQMKNKKTEDAKRWFNTPPYYFGERRHKDGQHDN